MKASAGTANPGRESGKANPAAAKPGAARPPTKSAPDGARKAGGAKKAGDEKNPAAAKNPVAAKKPDAVRKPAPAQAAMAAVATRSAAGEPAGKRSAARAMAAAKPAAAAASGPPGGLAAGRRPATGGKAAKAATMSPGLAAGSPRGQAPVAIKPSPLPASAPPAGPRPPQDTPSAVAPAASAPIARSGEAMRRPPGMPPGPPALTPRLPAKAEVFQEGDHVVYPTHGVGKVERIAVEEIAGHKLELIHITFEENRMTLRVPVAKARSAGLRKLATRKLFDEAMDVLRGKARIKRTMWSRRAQEYEAKINSGDPLAIAEVVRDLHRNAGQPDQSFSERQIYEAAMDRLAAELAALDQTDKATASTKLVEFLKTIA